MLPVITGQIARPLAYERNLSGFRISGLAPNENDYDVGIDTRVRCRILRFPWSTYRLGAARGFGSAIGLPVKLCVFKGKCWRQAHSNLY